MPTLTRTTAGAVAFGIAILIGTVHAQVGRGGSEWLTARGDAQRTSWIRTDSKISVLALQKPGFDLQWTTPLDNANRGTYGINQGVSAGGVTLFVPMLLVTGSSNNVFAIDSDTGYVVWQRHFEAPLPAATDSCPGGTTAAATRLVSVAPPPIGSPEQGFGGRGGPAYRSVLGEPGQGAPVEMRGGGPGRAGVAPAAARGNAGAAPGGAAAGAGGAGQRGTDPASGRAGAAGGSGGAGGGRGTSASPVPGAPAELFAGGGLGRPSGVVYAVSSDGVLHVMGLMTGKDLQRPAQFVPANSRWSDPIAVNTTMYTSTSARCGNAPDAVWAIDLDSDAKPVVSWKSGGPIVGTIAFTTEGTLVAAVGPASAPSGTDAKANAIVTLDAKTLQVKDWFSAPGVEFATGPTVFRHGSREIIAAATKDGRVLLLDAAAPGGPRHSTPLASSPPGTGSSGAADALASWQELTGAPPIATPGTRWILVPATGTVVALRVVDAGGTLSLERGWTAGNVGAPATPIVVNGVVFVLDTGLSAAGAASAAVLRAYEGVSGKELWNSGKTLGAAASPGSFWSAFGQVYVGTGGGTLSAFGFTDERR